VSKDSECEVRTGRVVCVQCLCKTVRREEGVTMIKAHKGRAAHEP